MRVKYQSVNGEDALIWAGQAEVVQLSVNFREGAARITLDGHAAVLLDVEKDLPLLGRDLLHAVESKMVEEGRAVKQAVHAKRWSPILAETPEPDFVELVEAEIETPPKPSVMERIRAWFRRNKS